MSMNACLVAVRPALLEPLRHDAEVREALLDARSLVAAFGGDDPDNQPSAVDAMLVRAGPFGCVWSLVPRAVRRAFLGRVVAPRADAPATPDEPEGAGALLTLGKDFHVVHWLLTGSWDVVDAPVSDAVLGGDEIGEDLGHGRARLVLPARAAAVAEALANLDLDAALARLGAEPVPEEVYGAEVAAGPAARAVLARRLHALRAFYADVARAGDGVLIWLT